MATEPTTTNAAPETAGATLPPSEGDTDSTAQVAPESPENVSENGARTDEESPEAPSTIGEALHNATQEGQDERVAALSREAAGRRRRLREVEAERDQLRAQLDSRDRQAVEALAGTAPCMSIG